MRILVSAFLFTALAGAVDGGGATSQQLDSPSQQTLDRPSPTSTITVPTGTKIVLALTSPLWAKSAKPGDTIYSSTAFPVAVNNEIAIPPGTYVQGEIDTMTRPGWRSNRAVFQMHFTKLVFANGYTVALPSTLQDSSGSDVQSAPTKGPALPEVPTAIATVYVEVSSRSDILLDNGSQIEMVLQGPLALEEDRVAAAARQSKRLPVSPVKSATQCRPVPGTPGTSDTVIPGTPGTPGTPDTVITGAPGTPSIVIPGIPATPGTPPTIIPGSPGTPGVSCPGPPVVVSSPSTPDVHKKSLTLNRPVQVTGKELAAGKYEVIWTGLGPTAQVDIFQKGKPMVHARARVVTLDKKIPTDATSERTNADGSVSLASVQFAGEIFELFFD
jgi:hypothetical protein